MGVGKFFHHIGTFCLFAAAILLLIATISAPVVNHISLLRVNFNNGVSHSEYSFGTFGYCQLSVDGGGDRCSKKMIGYNPGYLVGQVDKNIDVSTAGEDTAKALTRVMVLHPVGCALAFIAFLFAIGTGTFLSFISSVLSGIAFIVTIIVLATDFAGLSIIHHDVNKSGNKAKWGAAIWCVLVAAILLIFSTALIFLTCCAARRSNKKHASTDNGFAAEKTRRKKRFAALL